MGLGPQNGAFRAPSAADEAHRASQCTELRIARDPLSRDGCVRPRTKEDE